MTCIVRLGTPACAVLLFVSTLSATGKKNPPKADPGLPIVQKVLRAEVAGQVDRREQLAGAFAELSDSPAVRWQAGFVRDGQSWRSFDEFPSSTGAIAALADYQARRRDTAQDFASQLSLADWCRTQKLTDQERAHLNAALALAPVDQINQIRERLGWRQRAGVWFSPEEIQEWRKLNEFTAASLKRWESKLNQIAKGLSSTGRQRDIALRSLQEVKDPDAVPALELTLAGLSEEAALAVIGALRRIEGPVSSLALAKLAVFSQWPEVRRSSATGLKSRALEEFIPPLISLLATPVKSELRVATPVLRGDAVRGQFVLRVTLVLSRETENQFQVAAFNETNFEINEALNGARISHRSSDGNVARTPGVIRGGSDALRSSVDRVAVQQRAVDEINAQTAEVNERVGAVLAVVSGNDPTSDPQFWWNWWRTQSDTELAGDKQTVVVTEEFLAGNPYLGFQFYDCLAAGTPVWTDQGLRTIEKISVGDRVLAQDVETGELGYKPVLRTTTRPPKELWTLRFGDERVVMTGGHRCWCPGSGWVKARDLESQMLLHTVTGNSRVWTARKGETAGTYNLVVADFHTYFIGKSGILSQDVITPRGTDNLVPGLSRKDAVAQVKK